jgi:hypothetical protein
MKNTETQRHRDIKPCRCVSVFFNVHRAVFTALLLCIPVWAFASDPISELQERLKNGEAKLEYEPNHGYLISLLKNLNVSVSSQTLVFSKTSLQSERISPKTPRALYFNDDVYVAWVQGASTIEIMSVDPQRGSAFYALGQENDGRPEFERVTGHICSVCHYDQNEKKFVPKLVFSSVIPDETGNVEGTYPIPTTDQSPMEERWGGWYVTGQHGAQRHLGNIALKTPATPLGDLSRFDVSRSSNLTDLRGRFDTTPYLGPGSDIVALMVLAHQVDVQNLMTLAAIKSDVDPKETGEPLVKAMLFTGAAPFKEPIKGAPEFTKEFADRGPRDSHGRSLRDFDLKMRLFRYPLSYLIYSKSFDEMPQDVKTYVYRRLSDVLSGRDKSPDFSHLSGSDRASILEILRETKPEFRQSEANR